MSSSRMRLERINLNIPREARKKLRAVAKRRRQSESEVARSLLVDALDRAERDEFYRRAAEAQTPAARAREIAICRAFERLRG